MQHSAKKGAGEITEKCQREAAQAEATTMAMAIGRVATRTSPSAVSAPASAPAPAPFWPVAIYVLATLH